MNLSDDVALLVRVTGGLFVVLVVVAIVARMARRARGFGAGDQLRVVERVGLSRDAYVAVVEAGGRSLLLGVSPAGMSLLAPLDVPAVTPPEPVRVVVETTSSGSSGRHAREPDAEHQSHGGAPADAGGGMTLPTGVDLGGHPDLASALRAAGRTVAPAATQASPAQPAAAQPAARRARAAQVPQQRQASGSVLSPRTWRQGLDALRERTVRRG